MTLSSELDSIINQILIKSENQHEFLFGDCKSSLNLSSTQEHILMLLSDKQLSSTELARELSITQAAVTKSIKNLVKLKLLTPEKNINDARITYFKLTNSAQSIAHEHKLHHELTLKHYEEILSRFSEGEQRIISRFIKDLKKGLES